MSPCPTPPRSTAACLNLGVVAHVDAGKTSLTERLLFEGGAVRVLGRVDDGTTRTDSMDLERVRGITIRAAVATFAIDDLAVTIVDTPGHPDFIAEVERSLTVLDAAVLVLSAVEGVQPQSVVLWRALRRIGVPTVLFVNKIDRAGADVDRVVDQVRRRLTGDLVTLASVRRQGHHDAAVQEIPLTDASVVEALAQVDAEILAAWAESRSVDQPHLTTALRNAVGRNLTPLLCGSAVTGAGTPLLRHVLSQLVPAASDGTGEPAATVFAIDRSNSVRRAWIRVWSGEIAVCDRLSVGGRSAKPVTELALSTPGGIRSADVVRAGQIAAVRGPDCRIGDTIGHPPDRRAHCFPPATMQAVVTPLDPAGRGALFAALTELADEDPLIEPRLDEFAGEAVVRLHGEVQQEVVAALLAERFGVQARFTGTSVVCIERVGGAGEAVERIWAGDNPYLATIGLRVEAVPVGSGITFSPGLERGRLLLAFIAATEDGVRSALRYGLHGWAVTDCSVTMTASRYAPRQSHAHQKFSKSMSSVGADFRNLAQVVTLAALRRAGTVVCEPIERFDLEFPEELVGTVLGPLGRLGAVTLSSTSTGGYSRLTGQLASRLVPQLVRGLPDLTGGEAVLETGLDHHAPVADQGRPPSRSRPHPDPADRQEWFRNMPR